MKLQHFNAIMEDCGDGHPGRVRFMLNSGRSVYGDWTYIDNYMDVIVVDSEEQFSPGSPIIKRRTYIDVEQIASIEVPRRD